MYKVIAIMAIAFLLSGCEQLGIHVGADKKIETAANAQTLEMPIPAKLETASNGMPEDIQLARSYIEDPLATAERYEWSHSGTVSPDGYAQFDMECSWDTVGEGEPRTMWCAYGKMGEYTDAQLSGQLPLVLNSDVLRKDWSCTSICLDANGTLVGAVQGPMYHWLSTVCHRASDEDPSWVCPKE